MKLKELKEKIDVLSRINNGRCLDWDIEIPNNKGSVGGTSSTRVDTIVQGFDWNKGKIFLIPKEKMINKD